MVFYYYTIIMVGGTVLAGLTGMLLNWYISYKFHTKRKKRNVAICMLGMELLICAYSSPLQVLRGYLFLLLLLYASNSDIYTREVSNWIPLFIAETAVIGFRPENTTSMLLGILLALPMLIAAVMKEGSIGGADIKLTGASGFLLGLERGLVGLIAGLILAVVVNLIYRKVKKLDTKEAFPLVPYLAAGNMLAVFI